MACPIENAVCFARTHALRAAHYAFERDLRIDKQVNVVGHYDVGDQLIEAQAIRTMQNAVPDSIGDSRFSQPLGASNSFIEKALCAGKLDSGSIFAVLEAKNEFWRKRSE